MYNIKEIKPSMSSSANKLYLQPWEPKKSLKTGFLIPQ